MKGLRLLEGDAPEVAPLLLGAVLTSQIGGILTSVRIVEVEAYRHDDPASHSFSGPTARNATMFGPPGRLYVYRSYGIHWCANVVTGVAGVGAGVLLRGGIPIEGMDVMVQRRGRASQLTNGPGKLAQALGITREHDGTDLSNGLVRLEPAGGSVPFRVTPRIGITKAVDAPWRFVADL